ncbi:unnamed protein product [Effrenium voratum]|nr:unnamed protein product [Effrenium voratum]
MEPEVFILPMAWVSLRGPWLRGLLAVFVASRAFCWASSRTSRSRERAQGDRAKSAKRRLARPRSGPHKSGVVAEARRLAPPAPSFVPGLVRPGVVHADDLEADVMVVDEGSDFEEVARWVRAGGRALVVGHWRDLEQCRAGLLKPLREEAANAQEAEEHRAQKKQLSDRLLGPVGLQGQIALQGAPPAEFLQSLYGDLIEDAKREGRASAFALPSGVLMGLVNAWQYFQGGVRFPFLKSPVLSGPVRPFYGVYASPRPLAHFDLLIEWLQNRSSQPKRALDLGTGCGVVTLILQRIACVEEVVASDISPNAVYGATEEFKRHGLGVEVVCSDLFCELKGSFDLVVFNPPWLPLPKVDNEPRTALDGGNFYPEDLFRRFFDGLPEVLTPGGRALLLFSNHAVSRGYVKEHPFRAALARSTSKTALAADVVTREFNSQGRRRRSGRPQAGEIDEPCAELWEFRLVSQAGQKKRPSHDSWGHVRTFATQSSQRSRHDRPNEADMVLACRLGE